MKFDFFLLGKIRASGVLLFTFFFRAQPPKQHRTRSHELILAYLKRVKNLPLQPPPGHMPPLPPGLFCVLVVATPWILQMDISAPSRQVPFWGHSFMKSDRNSGVSLKDEFQPCLCWHLHTAGQSTRDYSIVTFWPWKGGSRCWQALLGIQRS